VLKIVRNLAIFNGVLIIAWGYTPIPCDAWSEIVSLLLTSVWPQFGSVACDLHLAAAVGARSLAKLGVLPTRLSAVDEAASIDVLCSDKTGTLTLNALSVTSVRPLAGFDDAHVLGLASLASSEGGQDSVDAAIRSAASRKPVQGLPSWRRLCRSTQRRRHRRQLQQMPRYCRAHHQGRLYCGRCPHGSVASCGWDS